MEHTLPFLGALVLALSTVPPVWQALVDRERREFYLVLAGITGIAAVAYVGIGLGFGLVTTNGRTWDVLRYLDWVVTTPLIVLYLAMLTRPGREAYLKIIGVDMLMILSGVAANVLPSPIRFVAFAVGGLAFLGLAWQLYVELEIDTSLDGDATERRALFEKLRNLTVVLWGIYPVVWLLSTKGLGLLLPGTEQVVTIYLDVLTKAGFTLIAVNGSETISGTKSSVVETLLAD
jgi:sensory rhodopsin